MLSEVLTWANSYSEGTLEIKVVPLIGEDLNPTQFGELLATGEDYDYSRPAPSEVGSREHFETESPALGASHGGQIVILDGMPPYLEHAVIQHELLHMALELPGKTNENVVLKYHQFLANTSMWSDSGHVPYESLYESATKVSYMYSRKVLSSHLRRNNVENTTTKSLIGDGTSAPGHDPQSLEDHHINFSDTDFLSYDTALMVEHLVVSEQAGTK
jgi:hypothetical protein